MTDYTRIYTENLNKLKCEMFSSDREASFEVRRLLEKHHYPYEYSRQQLNTWIGGNVKTLPSVAAAPYIARALKTNLGYLLGLHDVREMQIQGFSTQLEFDVFNYEYMKKHNGRTLTADGIVGYPWARTCGQDLKSARLKPFIRIALAIGWDIDYVLGFGSELSWKQYCLRHELLERLPEDTVFYITKPDGKRVLAGFSDGNRYINTVDGDFFKTKEIGMLHPVLVTAIDTV